MKSHLKIILSIIFLFILIIPPIIIHSDENYDGKYILLSDSMEYSSLKEAIEKAQETDTIKVRGKISELEDIDITKNITLIANTNLDMIISPKASENDSNVGKSLIVKDGKTLTLGGGDKNSLLKFDGLHIKVENGASLFFKDGIHISSLDNGSGVVELDGSYAKADFSGGSIEVPAALKNGENSPPAFIVSYCLYMRNGAKVSNIENVDFKGDYGAIFATGQDTCIEKISSGHFEQSNINGQSVGTINLEEGASISEISGGDFISRRFGSIYLTKGSTIKLISGGNFINKMDSRFQPGYDASAYWSAIVISGTLKDNVETGIEQITGGYFEGRNGILAVSNKPSAKVYVKEISGGVFKGLKGQMFSGTQSYYGKTFNADEKYTSACTGIYLTQNSYCNKIENVNSTGLSFGLYNSGTIKEISGGTFKGGISGFTNANISGTASWAGYFKGKIEKISNSHFVGETLSGIQNTGMIELIESGIFEGEKFAIFSHAIDKNDPEKGVLNKIENGIFIAKDGECCIYNDKELEIEAHLSTDMADEGSARFYIPYMEADNIFYNEDLVKYPEYKLVEEENNRKYFVSYLGDTKKVDNFDQDFYYLRKAFKLTYNYNHDDNAAYSSSYHELGEEIVLADNINMFKDNSNLATPSHATLVSWNTKADLNGDEYALNQDIDMFSDLDLYAKWIVYPKLINQAPIIYATDKVININQDFDPLFDTTASDFEDGNLSQNIQITENTVNKTQAGTYHIIYNVTDSANISTSKKIKVVVKDNTIGEINIPDNINTNPTEEQGDNPNNTDNNSSNGGQPNTNDSTTNTEPNTTNNTPNNSTSNTSTPNYANTGTSSFTKGGSSNVIQVNKQKELVPIINEAKEDNNSFNTKENTKTDIIIKKVPKTADKNISIFIYIILSFSFLLVLPLKYKK